MYSGIGRFSLYQQRIAKRNFLASGRSRVEVMQVDTADSPDVVIAKRLLDQVKQANFIFQRVASGEDAPLVGYRISDDWVDLIHIEGFSRDCFAWRQRVSSLIVSHDTLVQRMAEGSALDVLHEVLTWETRPLSTTDTPVRVPTW